MGWGCTGWEQDRLHQEGLGTTRSRPAALPAVQPCLQSQLRPHLVAAGRAGQPVVWRLQALRLVQHRLGAQVQVGAGLGVEARGAAPGARCGARWGRVWRSTGQRTAPGRIGREGPVAGRAQRQEGPRAAAPRAQGSSTQRKKTKWAPGMFEHPPNTPPASHASVSPSPRAHFLKPRHSSVGLPKVEQDWGELDAVLGGLGQHKVEAASHRVVQLACRGN